MGKKKRKKKQQKRSSVGSKLGTFVLVLLSILILAVLTLVAVDLLYGVSNGWFDPEVQQTLVNDEPAVPNASDAQMEQTTEQAQGITFPYALDAGNLEVTSIFQYSGMNPDCGDEMQDNITSVELTNRSNRHLASAKLKTVMSDGTTRSFEIADIPAGATVWAFDLNNNSYELSIVCESISCESIYEDATPIMQDKISVTATGTEVTLISLTDTELTGLTISCHCKFDGVYFGGKVYECPLNVLPAKGTGRIDVVDCYLGDAEVVRITTEQ